VSRVRVTLKFHELKFNVHVNVSFIHNVLFYVTSPNIYLHEVSLNIRTA